MTEGRVSLGSSSPDWLDCRPVARIFTGLPQTGHLAVFPIASYFAFRVFPQRHRIKMNAGVTPSSMPSIRWSLIPVPPKHRYDVSQIARPRGAAPQDIKCVLPIPASRYVSNRPDAVLTGALVFRRCSTIRFWFKTIRSHRT